ncbi:glycosyltransferase family 4 protein [Lutibacter sp.]|uniref:glycosyltransferase family 4 protein n=1 Tax=Lutibacter sp. TaxID=1925666 RepID=UPI00356B5326
MNIAFLTPEYPHKLTGKSGGIGTSIKNLANGLIAEGCEVLIIVFRQTKDAVFYDEGIEIHQIKNVKLKGLSWWLTRKKIEQKINDLHKNNKIDIVEAPDWTGITSYIQPKKCPVVIRLHGSDTYFCHIDGRKVKWQNKFHEKRALKKATGFISVSRFTADVTNAIFNLKKDFTIIPNGIDVNLFNANKQLSLHKDTILYYGTLIRKKGLLELPFIFNELMQLNPKSTLVLVGKDAKDIVTGSKSTWELMKPLFHTDVLKQVNYLGEVPYNEIKKYIEMANVCVFPTFAEALPVSWIEAMALQKAIVASNIGWATEVIDDGENGFIVHPTNHKEFALKINILLNDESLCKEFGKQARLKVEQQFSQKVVATQSIEFYKRYIK